MKYRLLKEEVLKALDEDYDEQYGMVPLHQDSRMHEPEYPHEREYRLSKSQRLSELQRKNDRKILEHIESLKDITMSLYTMVSHGDPRDELYKCGKNAWDIADKLYKLIRFKTIR